MATEQTTDKNTNRAVKSGRSNFLIQGSILAVAGIVVRIIGMIYRIPFIRTVGDEGNGYYSVAFEIYNIVLILSSYAFPTAVSKILSPKFAENDYRNVKRILKSALIYATLIGAAGCLFVLLTADWFANVFFMLPLCKYALLALAPTIWIMAYLGVFRGYFQGQSTMVPTALSQIIEQIVNAVVSVGAAWLFYNAALKAAQGDAMAAAKGAMGGTVGTGAGALAALIVVMLLFVRGRKERIHDLRESAECRTMTKREIAGLLLLTVIPIALSQIVYNINTIIDSKMFSNIMITRFGIHQSDVAADYGTFTGRFKTIINVPVAISNALGLSLIPALSLAVTKGDKASADSAIGGALRYISLISMPASVGLTVLGGPIIALLFGQSATAANMTLIGSSLVFFTSVSTVTNSVLQGSGNLSKPVIHSLISLVIHMAALYIMLTIFGWGVYSLIAANLVFAVCMTILNARTIRRKLGFLPDFKTTYLLPFICSLVMGGSVLAVRILLQRFVTQSSFVITVIGMITAVVIYVFMIIVTGTISREELKSFPVIGRFIKQENAL